MCRISNSKENSVENLVNIVVSEFCAAAGAVLLWEIGDTVVAGFVAAWDDYSFWVLQVERKEADLAFGHLVVFIWLGFLFWRLI